MSTKILPGRPAPLGATCGPDGTNFAVSSNGDEVTVSVNGHSVEATVAIRERMREGAAFLIEGTDDGNGNVLANGAPPRIQVNKR